MGFRIIPARAGFTITYFHNLAFDGDHPRSRGVYDSKKKLDDFEAGSSPLARGLLAPNTTQLTVSRIIPARAGFTSRPMSPVR